MPPEIITPDERAERLRRPLVAVSRAELDDEIRLLEREREIAERAVDY